MSEKFKPEQMAKMEKSRTLSDAELLNEGAEYNFNKKGEKQLILTIEQKEQIHKEMENNLSPDEQKLEQFVENVLRDNTPESESNENKIKFEKLLNDMNEQMENLDNLLLEVGDTKDRKVLDKAVGILKSLIGGKLKENIKEHRFCCIGDTTISESGVKLDKSDKDTEIRSLVGVTPKIAEKYDKNLRMAIDRLLLEVYNISIKEKTYSENHDTQHVISIARRYGKEMDVSDREATIGIVNRLRNQGLKVDGDKIKVIEQ